MVGLPAWLDDPLVPHKRCRMSVMGVRPVAAGGLPLSPGVSGLAVDGPGRLGVGCCRLASSGMSENRLIGR